MSTNTWLQNSLQKLLHTRDRNSWGVQLATSSGREYQSSRKQICTFSAFYLPVLPLFYEVVGLGWYVLSTTGQQNWHWHWNLFCFSKPSKQGILEVINGGVLKYFQYHEAGFTNKWHFVNTDKKNHCNIICKIFTRRCLHPFQVQNIWHFLVNISEIVCERAGIGTHSSFL